MLEKFGMTVQPPSAAQSSGADAADAEVVALFGDASAEPDALVAALVGARVRVRGFAVESAEPRGPFRVADR